MPQNVEIWSIGCILSEVATWITEGVPKVLEYRRRRALEVHGKSARHEELFFHDYKVLEAVKQMHEEIKQNSRSTDRITDAVIQRLVKAMMITDHHARAPAKHFLDQSRQILDEARPAPGHTVSDEVMGTSRPPRLPPVLPPGFHQVPQLPLDSNFYPARPVRESLPNGGLAGPGPELEHFAAQAETPTSKRTSGHPSYPTPSSRVTSGIYVPPQPSSDSTTAAVFSPLHPRSDSEPNSAGEPSVPQNPAQDHRLHLPFMSVADGLNTKRDKDKKIPCKYTGEDLIHTLDTVLQIRDHVRLFHP